MSDAHKAVFLDDVRFAPNEPFSIETVRAEHDEDWFNQSLVSVNESVLRFAQIHGEFHHHHHETDELFFVLSGEMEVDLDDQTLSLKAGEGVMISAGTVHRTRAKEPAQLLVIAEKFAKMVGVLSQ